MYTCTCTFVSCSLTCTLLNQQHVHVHWSCHGNITASMYNTFYYFYTDQQIYLFINLIQVGYLICVKIFSWILFRGVWKWILWTDYGFACLMRKIQWNVLSGQEMRYMYMHMYMYMYMYIHVHCMWLGKPVLSLFNTPSFNTHYSAILYKKWFVMKED